MSAMILESVLVHQNAKMYLVPLRANVRMALLGTVCYANVSVLQRILQVNSCCSTFFYPWSFVIMFAVLGNFFGFKVFFHKQLGC